MIFGPKPGCGLIFVFFCAAVCPVEAQPVSALIQRALSNNRDYLASLERVREAEVVLRQAAVRPAPTLDAEGGSTRLLGSAGAQEYTISYSHSLETGGKRSKRVAVATFSLDIAKAEADERRRALIFEIAQAYVDALTAFRRVAVFEDIARIDSETLRLIAARVLEGDAAPLERQLLETEIARTEAESALAQARTETAVLALQQVGALPPGPAVLSPQPWLSTGIPDRNVLTRKALEFRPDLRGLRSLEAQAKASVDLARAERLPNITASARYAYRDTLFDQFGFDSAGALTPVRDRENVLSFGLSGPLFTGRKNQANIEAAVIREHEVRLRREHLDSTIPSQVSLAIRNWEAARKALDIYGAKILPQAERNLDVIRQAWQLGQTRFLDVLNEQRRLTELRLARVDAEAGLMRAWAELENAVGGEIR